MRSTTFTATVAVLFSTLAAAQTFTDCQPLEKTCPANPALGTTLTTDFTKGKSDDWTLAEGTTITYDKVNGAQFTITAGEAPTIGLKKYIQFGKVEVVMKASPGQGIISSFILESQDLDEIDWEWLGSKNGEVQTNFFGKGDTTTYDRGQTHAIAGVSTEFHTYTIEWTAEKTVWSVNGAVVRTLLYNDPLTHGGNNYPQTPMKVKMGSWIGCLDQAAAENEKTKYTCEWAGGPMDPKAGPFVMSVKSVTVQDYSCASEYSYGDKSGSWQSIVKTGECNGAPVSSSSGGKTTTKSSSAPILIETKTSIETSSSPAPTKAAVNNSTTTATTASTTLNTASVTRASTTSSTPAQVSGNSAATLLPSKKYGGLDLAVAVLGLGMGYFFM